MNVLQLVAHGDGVIRAVAVLLLAMSVASWVVILWKAWLLRGGTPGVVRSIAAFWRSASLADAERQVAALDRAQLVLPAVRAVRQWMPGESAAEGPGDRPGDRPGEDATLGAAGDRAQRLTRVLRNALHAALRRLQSGQILLATVGATAPFVGLLGTVWGIYRALAGIAAETGGFTIEKVAGPVGEALVMTAFGLAVAIPAVLAYNVFGRVVGRVEAELEGFAHDLLGTLGGSPANAPLPPARAMPL